MCAVDVVASSTSSTVGWRSAKKEMRTPSSRMTVNGPPLKSGARALLPAGVVESSMAVNDELPWRFGNRAR
eukprot:10377845-Lingulodinium_polyedra.AAC.1